VRVEFELPDIGAETGDKIVVSFWHVEEDEEFVEGRFLHTKQLSIFQHLVPEN
jgi:hypothetical protein